jgi:hypothetical protein
LFTRSLQCPIFRRCLRSSYRPIWGGPHSPIRPTRCTPMGGSARSTLAARARRSRPRSALSVGGGRRPRTRSRAVAFAALAGGGDAEKASGSSSSRARSSRLEPWSSPTTSSLTRKRLVLAHGPVRPTRACCRSRSPSTVVSSSPLCCGRPRRCLHEPPGDGLSQRRHDQGQTLLFGASETLGDRSSHSRRGKGQTLMFA